MPKSDPRPYVQVAVLHDAESGQRVAVSLMWLTTFTETAKGTEFQFTNGETVTVEEGFDVVAEAFGAAGRSA